LTDTSNRNVEYQEPVNRPGTPKEEQRCEFCLISLDMFGKPTDRCRISLDPDYIAANLCMYCTECRIKKLGKLPDSDYLEPKLKWRRIAYQAFWNSKNPDGFWRMVEDLHPFGDSPYDPRKKTKEQV